MLLRWNMLFFDFCVRYLRLFDYFSAGKTVLPKTRQVVLLEQRCQTCSKLGTINQTCSKYGLYIPNLQ